jgi:hypothetical protein
VKRWPLALLLALCTLSLIAEWWLPPAAHAGFEPFFGFDAVFAFGAGVVAVLLARWLRRILQRDESYYD